jgi:hypothetical protein
MATTQTAQIALTVTPITADQTATWTTSNATVATVSSSGVVTAKAVGTATITAKSNFDATKTAICAVTVSGTGVLTNFFKQLYTGTRNDYPSCVGYEFVPAADITVTALGRAVSGTMTQNHLLRIWTVSSQSVLTSVTVTPSSTTDALGYKYEMLSSPVTLSSGVAYRITSNENLYGDAFMDYGSISNHSNLATITDDAYADYNNYGYPNNPYGNGAADHGYMGPTFYTISGATGVAFGAKPSLNSISRDRMGLDKTHKIYSIGGRAISRSANHETLKNGVFIVKIAGNPSVRRIVAAR